MTEDGPSPKTWPYCAVILLGSVLYYGSYIDVGFSPADDGNYAQIAYELFLGRSPENLTFSYGLLWFKVGEGLFHLFGVDYGLVKGLFYTVITATNVLIFYTVLQVSGSRMFALSVAAVPLVVPAFPATAFYGFCVLLNAAAQMRIAKRLSACTWQDAALAGAALSLSFQIRPDFGYIWMMPLVVLLALSAGGCWAKMRSLFGAAVLAFLVVQIPMILLALSGGYAGLMTDQYLGYPATMIDYAFGGLRGLLAESGGTLENAAATALKRPGLGAIIAADTGLSRLAVLIYAPVLVLGGFLIAALVRTARHWKNGQRERIAVSIVAFFSGAAAFPHYFFYRPDMAHVANFMPGYTVLAAVIILHFYRENQSTRTIWTRAVTLAGLSAVILHLGFYIWVGLQTAGTGSIAIAEGRTAHFAAANGVDVRASPAEKAQLEMVRDIIAQNSQPKDLIVCVPYCPGFAFMTGRRMLFDKFYVDDSTRLADPTWIDDAIALTRRSRPPVVIVMDWAINGTERSRFRTWASAYVAEIRSLAKETMVHPGLTVYLL